MICTTSDGILFPQDRSIGRFRTVVMPDCHLRMVFPSPTHRARTAGGVCLLGRCEQGARSKQRLKSSDLEEDPSSKGHVCALNTPRPTKSTGWKCEPRHGFNDLYR